MSKRSMTIQAAVALSHSNPINPMTLTRKTPSDSTARVMRGDHDEAMVCLTCTKKKCTGERGCYNARLRQLAKEGFKL